MRMKLRSWRRIMVAQVDFNQQAEKIHSQESIDTLTSAKIKDHLGEEVLIEWDTENKEQALEMGNKKTSKKQQIESKYGVSTKEALNMQVNVGGKIYKNGKWVNATSAEIQKYFIPSQENIEKYKYQFLNLSAPAGISEEDAAAYLKNKGILEGQASTFIKAAKENNINEIYLMAHASLETGNGTSKLATGVSYNGVVVYNMFGIKAVDRDPIGQGAAYAYKMGWTSPEKAILGGAKFISEQYINREDYKQDTLYEMRWNPASPGTHQYATDIGWAVKQAAWIQKIYESFDNPDITFDIPKYRGTY